MIYDKNMINGIRERICTERNSVISVIKERIRTERNRLKISQQGLADLLYCHVQSIKNWENMKSKDIPSLDMLLDMCNLFECEIGYLLGEHTDKTRTATDIQAAIGLNEQSQAVLAKYVVDKDEAYSPRIMEICNNLIAKEFIGALAWQIDIHATSAQKDSHNKAFHEFQLHRFYFQTVVPFFTEYSEQLKGENNDAEKTKHLPKA